MADYLTNMVSWTVVVLLAIISGSEATYCYTDYLISNTVYCAYGCCDSYTSDPCCEYISTYDYWMYLGIGGSSTVLMIIMTVSIYFCINRRRQTAAAAIINGTPTTTVITGHPSTTMYPNTGVPTSYMQPGVGYPQTVYYPTAGVQLQPYYPPQPTNATAAPPPAYDSLDKSAGVDNAGYTPSAPY